MRHLRSIRGMAAYLGVGLCVGGGFLPGLAFGDTSSILVQKQTQAFGSPMGFSLTSTPNAAQNGLLTAVKGSILGKQRALMNYNVEPSTDLTEGKSAIFVGGIQVVSTPLKWNDGSLKASVAIPPVKVSVPLVMLPIGPFMINVGAGFALSAALSGSLTPLISIPVQYSLIEADVQPNAQAAGFVEGSVQLVALRGGVGGQVTVVDANADINAKLSGGIHAPVLTLTGFLNFLSGSFYAFADYLQIFGWKWHRFWNPTLYQWKGFCMDLTHNTQSGSLCKIP